MKATTNLEDDHVHILRLIDVMEQVTMKPGANTDHLETIVGLIKNFADGLHHNKEEILLFPKMVEKGFSFHQGPVAVMMNDHVQGRAFVKGMADNIALLKDGNRAALSAIYENMKGYIELLRAHIAKENNVLFRMADNVLSDSEQQSLLEEFVKINDSPVCGKHLENCIDQINFLDSIYLK
ncbi:MAG: hemerythrin domain-containing protein [Bacteroidales bacterium]|jgi:hemerythrin-like domain-containing protein|nr:hemerythrin domain-containing protein [Bacteroidales bacterium]